MRVFLAITFDDETLDKLEACRDRLCARSTQASPVARENLHLTLAFLGNISDDDLFAIEDALDDITNPLENTLVFDRAGTFGGARRSGSKHKAHVRGESGSTDSPEDDCTWWLGIQPNERLMKLQSALQSALENIGLAFDERAFTPHVTLARRVVASTDEDLALTVAGEAFEAHLNSFSLMESRTVGSASGSAVVYEEICTWE